MERADVSARDFHVRGFALRPLGRVRFELGLDVNGRYGLEALDIGLLYSRDGALTRTNTNVSVGNARRLDAGLYASLAAGLARALALAGGVRVDRVTTHNVAGFFGDRSTENAAASGFVALTAGPFSGLTATLQLARGFRDPVLSDRYFRGPSGRGFITGNPRLDPETSLQVDGSLRYSLGRVHASLFGYEYRFEDLIERYQSETDFFFFRNRGRARIHGVELELQSDLAAGFRLSLAGHVVRGRALADGTGLDDSPPDTLILELRSGFGRGFVQARGGLYARQDRPGPNEQERDGYSLVDASGGLRLGPGVELRALVRNLFDEEHLASPDARAPLAAGRSPPAARRRSARRSRSERRAFGAADCFPSASQRSSDTSTCHGRGA